MNVWKSYLRWRHSRGFGVHSPFAYSFVTTVLRPGIYGLYSYDKIKTLLPSGKKEDQKLIRLLKFILRLMVFLDSKRLVIVCDSDHAAIPAHALGIHVVDLSEKSSKANFEFKEQDLLLTDKKIDEKFLKKAIESRINIFALNPDKECREILTSPLSRGLCLNGRRRIILIPRKDMAYVSYEIRLKER